MNKKKGTALVLVSIQFGRREDGVWVDSYHLQRISQRSGWMPVCDICVRTIQEDHNRYSHEIRRVDDLEDRSFEFLNAHDGFCWDVLSAEMAKIREDERYFLSYEEIKQIRENLDKER